jgi:hypothetical protein
MPNEAERLEILKMVQNKQISPEDGGRLLKALTDNRGPAPTGRPPVPNPGLAGRWFKLTVDEPGGERVNLALPLGAVPTILRFVQRWVPEEYRDAVHAATETVNTGFRGEILRVDEPGGQRVRIWIE